MKTYNKLVRDKIPEIIRKSGQKPSTRTAGPEEMMKLLAEKLVEEALEFRESLKEEELADVMEVALELASRMSGPDRIDELRKKKREKRGGFEKGIVLISVE